MRADHDHLDSNRNRVTELFTTPLHYAQVCHRHPNFLCRQKRRRIVWKYWCMSGSGGCVRKQLSSCSRVYKLCVHNTPPEREARYCQILFISVCEHNAELRMGFAASTLETCGSCANYCNILCSHFTQKQTQHKVRQKLLQ